MAFKVKNNRYNFPVNPLLGDVQTEEDQPQMGLLGGGMNPLSMGLLGSGAAMLDASGPSRVPVSMGQAIGKGLMGGLQGYQASIGMQNEQEKLRILMEKAQQDLRGGNPYFQFLPTSQGYAVGDARTGTIQAPGQGNVPTLMRGTDDPRLQGQIAGARKAGESPYDFIDMTSSDGSIASVPKSAVVDGQVPTMPGGGVPKAISPRQQAAELAAGKVSGEAVETARQDLGKTVAQGEEISRLVDELISHPGRKLATGTSSMLGVQKIPGTPAYDFMLRLKQIEGKQFMEAFSNLKGGGQITEKEGEKATEAIARMKNTASEEEFVTAAKEFKGIVENATARAKSKAAGSTRPASAAFGGVNPETGQMEYFDAQGNKL